MKKFLKLDADGHSKSTSHLISPYGSDLAPSGNQLSGQSDKLSKLKLLEEVAASRPGTSSGLGGDQNLRINKANDVSLFIFKDVQFSNRVLYLE